MNDVEKTTLSVLTFNAWILRIPLIGGKDVAARFARLPEALIGAQADIICLQEIWHPRDRQALYQSLRPAGYEYCFERTKNLADGLLILSKFPGAGPKFLRHEYGASGWERFLGKGTLYARIQHPTLGDVDVLNIHLQAATDTAIRKMQIERLMEWQPFAGHVVLAGDFNFPHRWQGATHPVYEWFLKTYQLRDAYRDVHGALTRDGTYDHEQNRYAVSGPELGAIDYLFYRLGGLRAQSAELLYKSRPELSDHFGVKATFS